MLVSHSAWNLGWSLAQEEKKKPKAQTPQTKPNLKYVYDGLEGMWAKRILNLAKSYQQWYEAILEKTNPN